MLRWALIFLVITIVSAVFGYTNMVAGTTAIARVTFLASFVLFLIFMTVGIALERKRPSRL